MKIITKGEISSLIGGRFEFYFPSIPGLTLKEDDIDGVVENYSRSRKKKRFSQLEMCVEVFLELCNQNRNAFGFLPFSRNQQGEAGDDNPGCDLIVVSDTNADNSRHVFMIEIKDQQLTNQKQWNDKIRKLDSAPIHKVIKRLHPSWTFNIVLAGRNKSTFEIGTRCADKRKKKHKKKRISFINND